MIDPTSTLHAVQPCVSVDPVNPLWQYGAVGAAAVAACTIATVIWRQMLADRREYRSDLSARDETIRVIVEKYHELLGTLRDVLSRTRPR